jgi:hypothetical protein
MAIETRSADSAVWFDFMDGLSVTAVLRKVSKETASEPTGPERALPSFLA